MSSINFITKTVNFGGQQVNPFGELRAEDGVSFSSNVIDCSFGIVEFSVGRGLSKSDNNTPPEQAYLNGISCGVNSISTIGNTVYFTGMLWYANYTNQISGEGWPKTGDPMQILDLTQAYLKVLIVANCE